MPKLSLGPCLPIYLLRTLLFYPALTVAILPKKDFFTGSSTTAAAAAADAGLEVEKAFEAKVDSGVRLEAPREGPPPRPKQERGGRVVSTGASGTNGKGGHRPGLCRDQRAESGWVRAIAGALRQCMTQGGCAALVTLFFVVLERNKTAREDGHTGGIMGSAPSSFHFPRAPIPPNSRQHWKTLITAASMWASRADWEGQMP